MSRFDARSPSLACGLRWILVAVGLMILGAGPALSQTAFTYQAELEYQGAPANGEFDFTFSLFNVAVGGTAIAAPILLEDVEARNGYVTVELDFGDVFDGTPKFLFIEVKPAGAFGPFTPLAPRKAITSTPEAVFARRADETDTVDGLDAVDLSIQSVELVGTELRITQGVIVFVADLAPLVPVDLDDDPTNEFNTAVNLAGTDLQVTDAGGTLVADLSTLQDGVDDADPDPANEVITGAALLTNLLQLIENGEVTNLADVSALLNTSMVLNGQTLEVTDGGGTLSVDLSSIPDGVDDADIDPGNELNTGLAFDGTSVSITDAGGTVEADITGIPVEDADANPLNEVITDLALTNSAAQLEIVEGGLTNLVDTSPLRNATLGFDGATLTVTDGGGTLSADLSSLGTDADSDPGNELNTGVGFAGTTVSVTDAGGTLQADIAGIPVEDADADPTNELITDAFLTNNADELAVVEAGITNTLDVQALQNAAIGFDGTTLTVTDGGGTLQADISSLGDDADADPGNELNTSVGFAGTTVSVTDAGGTLQADISGLPVEDADADPTNELIDDAYLTNGADRLEIVEAGITNALDVTALQNSDVSFDGTNLTMTDGGGTLQADLSALANDADADPTNELNTAVGFAGTTVSVTDAGGTLQADISGLPVNDADDDPTNELISSTVVTNGSLEVVEAGTTNVASLVALRNTSVNFDGTTLSVTDGGGTLQADISALGNDADPDPGNELNTGLAFDGTNVTVTDAGATLSADLTSLLDGNLDADADPANELISQLVLTNAELSVVDPAGTNLTSLVALRNTSVTFDGTSLSVTDGGGTLTADISALGDDADPDPTNELNTGLSFDGTTVTVTDAGGSLQQDLTSVSDGTADADADPTNELISSLTLTTNAVVRLVEAGVTNDVDASALQNVSMGFDGSTLTLTDGVGPVTADLSALEDPNLTMVLTNAVLQITDAGGTVSADLSPLDGINDLDVLPSNELITNAVLDAGNVLQIDENGSVSSVDLNPLIEFEPSALYSQFGWAGSSGPVANPRGANDLLGSKTLQITEVNSSNTFEVDFNRIQPGTLITNLPFTINQPGFYYLTRNLTNANVNGDGITIDTDNVTIDLMGYSLSGGFDGTGSPNSDDGIVVLGSQTNIKIRNGTVLGWDGDGINALNADFSIFTDLRLQGNEGDGLVADFNCIIDSCTAFSNGFDGLEGDDGTVIHNSTAGQNSDNGIQTSEGCVVRHCASFDNGSDGFDVGAGSVVRNCVATDNGIFGFDIALGAMATACVAYDNMSNGFDMASACILRDCIGSLNSGHGVRMFANSYVTDCKMHENDLDGIRISSTDCFVAHNQTTDNDQTGISATSSGSLIIANTCAGNLTNYNIDANCAFGQIIDVTNVGDLSLVAGADHPWANFSY